MAEKPLREVMPTIAAWIDELREAFGAATINAAIRNGVAGGSRFYAEEGGQQLGCDSLPGGIEVGLRDMVIIPAKKGGRE